EIGGVDCLLVVCRDITQAKLAEKKLQVSEEKFAKAFRASPEMMLIVSLDEGRLLEVNEAFERQFGYSREDVLGRNDSELNIWLSPTQGEHLRSQIQAKGQIRNQEVQLHTRSGDFRTVLVSTETIELEGQPCLLAVAQDITALKHSERHLRE